MKKSNCCNAPLVDETDVCSRCKEHCEFIEKDVNHTETLKQFDKADLIKTLGHYLDLHHDEKFITIFLNDLHVKKYNRLIDSIQREAKVYETQYKRYENKKMPKEIQITYGKFIRSLEKIEQKLKAHKEVMISAGLVKKEK